MRHRAAIIGAGPAGITAAVQLNRYGIDFVLFERNKPGGSVINANLIENYPGFPDGISGPSLAELLNRHLMKFDIDFIKEEVIELNYENEEFIIKSERNIYNAGLVVIACGASPKEPDIYIPDDCSARVYHEIAGLAAVSDKIIAILGAGDVAFDYALNLARNNTVLIINRSNTTKCLPILKDRALASSNISLIESSAVESLHMNNSGLILKIRDSSNNKIKELAISYLLFATGKKSKIDFFTTTVCERLDELKTSGRLYIAGDVKNYGYRQVSIAVGDGMKCAMEINKLLRDRQE